MKKVNNIIDYKTNNSSISIDTEKSQYINNFYLRGKTIQQSYPLSLDNPVQIQTINKIKLKVNSANILKLNSSIPTHSTWAGLHRDIDLTKNTMTLLGYQKSSGIATVTWPIKNNLIANKTYTYCEVPVANGPVNQLWQTTLYGYADNDIELTTPIQIFNTIDHTVIGQRERVFTCEQNLHDCYLKIALYPNIAYNITMGFSLNEGEVSGYFDPSLNKTYDFNLYDINDNLVELKSCWGSWTFEHWDELYYDETLDKYVILENVGKATLTGEEGMSISGDSSYIYFAWADCFFDSYTLNSHFKGQHFQKEAGTIQTFTWKNHRVSIATTESYPTISAFRDIARAEYAKGTPISFVYILEEPNKIILNDATQEKLKSIQINNGFSKVTWEAYNDIIPTFGFDYDEHPESSNLSQLTSIIYSNNNKKLLETKPFIPFYNKDLQTFIYYDGANWKKIIDNANILESIAINGDTSVSVGNTIILTPITIPNNYVTTFTWSSTNTSVATVDENGEVTGVAAGSVYITCKDNNSLIKGVISITCT